MINNRRTICILGGTGTVGVTACSTVDSLMSWNYQSVEKILNQLTKMHFRTAKLSETLLLAIKAR